MELQARKLVPCRDINVRITLVVPEDDVELRPVLLDQVVLEDQRLGLGIRHRDLDFRDKLHHGSRLYRVVAASEVARDAFLQISCLADVKDLVLCVEHPVHTGTVRQAPQE